MATLTKKATKLPGYGNTPGQTQSKVPTQGFGNQPNSISLPPTFHPQVPQYAAAQAGVAPQVGGAGGGGTSSDPRDPTYWSEVGKIWQTFGTNNDSYNLQESQGKTQLTTAIAALDKQEPVDKSNTRGSYNANGGFYGSRLGSALTDLTGKYKDSRIAANTGFGNLVDSLNILRNNNQVQYGRGPNGELTGSAYTDALNAGVGRATTADTTAADNNALVPKGDLGQPATPTNPAAAQTLINQLQKQPYSTVAATNSKGEKGVWHNYPDGRRVFVKS